MSAVSKSGAAPATPATATPSRTPKTPSGPMRTIDDPSTIQYPPSVKAPFGSKDPQSGKITYEPDFLLQFAPLCLDTSEDLSQFQNMNEENDRGPRSGMSRRQTSDRSRGPRTPSSPMDMFRHGSRDGRGEMGKFAGGRPLSHRTGSGSHGLPPAGGAGGMQREGSHGGRSRSGRGGKGRHGGKDSQERQEKQQQGAPTIPPEQVVPLEKSENRWVPLALRKQREAEKAAESDLLSDEVIIRKVKALLNKLTLEKFNSISGQIWEYAKQSEKEEDGRALKIVIQLTFEKACDEAPFAVMWAQLCRHMYDSITDDIKDVNTLDKHGNVVSGVNLFRKYLLNRCQHDFERGWKMQIPKVDESDPDMLSDEYYAAVKAKRQGLGLVQFIGEMFKRHMLTDRIMLQCLTRLCDNPREVGDEETETMVKMVTTIGRALDISNRSNKEWMDAYFERMKEMMESPNLSSRVKFMIMDLFDLRKNKWVSRRGNQPAPTTIAQVHQQAQKAKTEEKEAMKRTSSSRGSLPHPMSRAGSHRGGGGGARDLQREGSNGGGQAASGDGWNTVTSSSPGGTSKGSRVNELANFGKTDRSKARSNVLGPSNSPFASLHRAKTGGDQKSSPSESRSSSANMFSALGGEEEGQHESAPPAEPATAAPTTTPTTTSTTGSAPQQDD
ncbi:armadillo-type protein [Fennellomyces sp. T-0311]|nr:armadillo-type protein [Fennellomyces sp. T-0311]